MTDIIARVKASPELGPRIVPDLPFCRAEILHAVEYEMARTLMDIVRRRIPLLILTRLRQETLDEICGFVAPVLHWDTARQEQEVASVLERLDL